jgi:hypothetical protein
MGHEAVECKSPLRMATAVPRLPRCRWIHASVLAVATSKCFRLPNLLHLLGSRGVQREEPRIIRMFGPQGRSFGRRNQCNLHRVMPTAMPSLNTDESEEDDDFHQAKNDRYQALEVHHNWGVARLAQKSCAHKLDLILRLSMLCPKPG